jgi:hypothetical protein
MKTTQQIEDDIKAREAELQSLRSAHAQMVQQFNAQCVKNEAHANFLVGQINALQGLLPKPRRPKKEGQPK